MNMIGGNPHSVVANMPDGNILVNEFELQSRYYVHFWTNNFRKVMNLVISFPSPGVVA